jgi:hypothetical protein
MKRLPPVRLWLLRLRPLLWLRLPRPIYAGYGRGYRPYWRGGWGYRGWGYRGGWGRRW